jgi:hypothetical protein
MQLDGDEGVQVMGWDGSDIRRWFSLRLRGFL